jgi:hypothetical protein
MLPDDAPKCKLIASGAALFHDVPNPRAQGAMEAANPGL